MMEPLVHYNPVYANGEVNGTANEFGSSLPCNGATPNIYSLDGADPSHEPNHIYDVPRDLYEGHSEPTLVISEGAFPDDVLICPSSPSLSRKGTKGDADDTGSVFIDSTENDITKLYSNLQRH